MNYIWAKFLFFMCVLMVILPTGSFAIEYVSPRDFRLDEARTGVERYKVLYNAHVAAIREGKGVDYSGIDKIEIQIPYDSESIPLPEYVDFAGVEIIVKNISKKVYLFSMVQRSVPVDISADEIKNLKFSFAQNKRDSLFLLEIKDGTPWISNRKGYNYGVTRKDIILVENAKGSNSPTYSYNSRVSSPIASYCHVSRVPKEFKNLIFTRSSDSTQITCLINVSRQYDVILSNVTVNTLDPKDINGDTCINITNSVKVTLHDIVINGTYSQRNLFGYGISLDNIYDLCVEGMDAHSNWGVFGSNNINKAELRNCRINRFDIHCYGRDVSCYDCLFSDMYNQFSSVFGKIYYERCTFSNSAPVLIESSYNAYTPFDIIFKDCTFNMTKSHNYLVHVMNLTQEVNTRPELSSKCLPNVFLNDCTVNLGESVRSYFIFQTGNVAYNGVVSYLNKVYVSNLIISDKSARLNVFSKNNIHTKPGFRLRCKILDS